MLEAAEWRKWRTDRVGLGGLKASCEFLEIHRVGGNVRHVG